MELNTEYLQYLQEMYGILVVDAAIAAFMRMPSVPQDFGSGVYHGSLEQFCEALSAVIRAD